MNYFSTYLDNLAIYYCHSSAITVTLEPSLNTHENLNVDEVLMCQAGVELVKTILYYRPLSRGPYLGVANKILLCFPIVYNKYPYLGICPKPVFLCKKIIEANMKERKNYLLPGKLLNYYSNFHAIIILKIKWGMVCPRIHQTLHFVWRKTVR